MMEFQVPVAVIMSGNIWKLSHQFCQSVSGQVTFLSSCILSYDSNQAVECAIRQI